MTVIKHRRFMLLAVALVALNSFFWLAQGGFAIPRAVINDLFGSRLVRAEVLVQTGSGTADYRIDRGTIIAASPTSFTLKELDGSQVIIDVDPSARIQGGGRVGTVAQLRKRLGSRVTVVRDANGPVSLIQVEALGGK